MTIKLFAILTALGVSLSGILNTFWGGWSSPMTTLCIVMAVDYVSGILLAVVFHKSPKTPNGGASSEIGFKGLAKKLFLLMLVGVAYQLDRATGNNFIRDAAALFFIANEALSVLENAGLLGIPLPKVLRKGIELLKAKDDEALMGAEQKPPDGRQGTGPTNLAGIDLEEVASDARRYGGNGKTDSSAAPRHDGMEGGEADGN